MERETNLLGRMVWDVITTRIHESGQFLFEGSWHDFDVEILEHGLAE